MTDRYCFLYFEMWQVRHREKCNLQPEIAQPEFRLLRSLSPAASLRLETTVPTLTASSCYSKYPPGHQHSAALERFSAWSQSAVPLAFCGSHLIGVQLGAVCAVRVSSWRFQLLPLKTLHYRLGLLHLNSRASSWSHPAVPLVGDALQTFKAAKPPSLSVSYNSFLL